MMGEYEGAPTRLVDGGRVELLTPTLRANPHGTYPRVRTIHHADGAT